MIARGPFNITWRGNTLSDIESVDIAHDVNTEDYEANSGIVYQIEKSRKTSVKITLLSTDIPSLAAVLPQYFVPDGGHLGDGTIVSNANGAIDIKSFNCDDTLIYSDLLIEACGSGAETTVIKHCRTIFQNIEISKIRKIVVEFIGEPVPGDSLIQFTEETAVNTDNWLLLDNGEPFLLDNGEKLLLDEHDANNYLLLDNGESFLLDNGTNLNL